MTENTIIKNEDALMCLAALDGLTKKGVAFSAKVWYILSKNKRQLAPVQITIKEVTEQLLKTYGSDHPKTGVRYIPQGTKEFQTFSKEMEEVLGKEETLKLHKVNLEDVLKVENLEGVEGLFEFFEFLVIDESCTEEEEPKA